MSRSARHRHDARLCAMFHETIFNNYATPVSAEYASVLPERACVNTTMFPQSSLCRYRELTQ